MRFLIIGAVRSGVAGAAGVCLAPNRADRGTPWLRGHRAIPARQSPAASATQPLFLPRLSASRRRAQSAGGNETARSREELRALGRPLLVTAEIAQCRCCRRRRKPREWGMAINQSRGGRVLAFIPAQDEHYDFAIPRSRWDSPAVQYSSEGPADIFAEALRAMGFRL